MTRMQDIIIGSSLTIAAIVTAAFTFPLIAGKAADARDTARWQARAAVFQAANINVSTLEISDISERLTGLMLDARFKNAFMRDQYVIADLEEYSHKDVLAAQAAMDQVQCMAEAVYYEARSETNSGQLAVAEVVLNRVKSKHFPDTVCDVVYQGAERRTGCQFSFTCDGSTLKMPQGRYWEISQAVAQLAMMDGYTPFMGRSTHYHTTAITPKWSHKLELTKYVGSHVFYSFPFRERPVRDTVVAVAPPI